MFGCFSGVVIGRRYYFRTPDGTIESLSAKSKNAASEPGIHCTFTGTIARSAFPSTQRTHGISTTST
jgi:hypothetical protein